MDDFYVIVSVDSREAWLMLRRLQWRLSPVGLHAYMQRKALPFLQARARARFAGEGDDATGKWAQLAHNTGLIRAKQGFPAWHPINVRTGALRTYVTTTAKVSSTGTGARILMPGTGGSKELQRKLKKAQRGGPTGKGKDAPPRPVVAVGAVDQRFLGVSLLDWIKEGAMR